MMGKLNQQEICIDHYALLSACYKAWRKVRSGWAWPDPHGETSGANGGKYARVQKRREKKLEPLQAQPSKDYKTAPPIFKVPTTIPLHLHTSTPVDFCKRQQYPVVYKV